MIIYFSIYIFFLFIYHGFTCIGMRTTPNPFGKNLSFFWLPYLWRKLEPFLAGFYWCAGDRGKIGWWAIIHFILPKYTRLAGYKMWNVQKRTVYHSSTIVRQTKCLKAFGLLQIYPHFSLSLYMAFLFHNHSKPNQMALTESDRIVTSQYLSSWSSSTNSTFCLAIS